VVLPDEAIDAINRAAELLHAGLERVELSLHLSGSWKGKMTEFASDSSLLCQAQVDDDSFRQYLKNAGAPKFILKTLKEDSRLTVTRFCGRT
jgi:hypothetical protein